MCFFLAHCIGAAVFFSSGLPQPELFSLPALGLLVLFLASLVSHLFRFFLDLLSRLCIFTFNVLRYGFWVALILDQCLQTAVLELFGTRGVRFADSSLEALVKYKSDPEAIPEDIEGENA